MVGTCIDEVVVGIGTCIKEVVVGIGISSLTFGNVDVVVDKIPGVVASLYKNNIHKCESAD